MNRLLLSDRNGEALSPLTLHLWSKEDCHSTLSEATIPTLSLLNAITKTMWHLASQQFPLRLCHLVDRAGDSAAHLRDWDASGHFFLVRGDEGHKLEWQGASMTTGRILPEVALRASYAIEWEPALTAQLFVSETQARLTRPSRKLDEQGRELCEKGKPLELRLIVCQVRLPDETVAARTIYYFCDSFRLKHV